MREARSDDALKLNASTDPHGSRRLTREADQASHLPRHMLRPIQPKRALLLHASA